MTRQESGDQSWEWIRKKWKNHRSWIKSSGGEETKEIAGMEVIEETVSDVAKFNSFANQARRILVAEKSKSIG